MLEIIAIYDLLGVMAIALLWRDISLLPPKLKLIGAVGFVCTLGALWPVVAVLWLMLDFKLIGEHENE